MRRRRYSHATQHARSYPRLPQGRASTSDQWVFVPCRPRHAGWAPPQAAQVPRPAPADTLLPCIPAETKFIVLSEVAGLSSTLGRTGQDVFAFVGRLRRAVPGALVLMGLNSDACSDSTAASLTSLCCLVAHAPAALQRLPSAAGTQAGRGAASLGEVQLTVRHTSSGKVSHSLQPFCVHPTTGALDYKAGLAAVTGSTEGGVTATPSPGASAMPDVIEGSSHKLALTAQELEARAKTVPSYQHQGASAPTPGAAVGTSSAPLITLELGDADTSSSSSDDEED